MAFTPDSTIMLCNVPFDISYKHVVRHANRTAQQAYFMDKVVKTFSDYLTVRKTLPGGGTRSSVKVGMNIDAVRSLPCNYMFYKNANHGERIFYAFITEVIYINDDTTELVFETDVYQTWFLECEMKPCYVVREHSVTDVIGEHIVPESFNIEDYTYVNLGEMSELNEWGYLICYAPDVGTGDMVGQNTSGLFQGLAFIYEDNIENLRGNLEVMLNDRPDEAIVSITPIPKFSIPDDATITQTTNGRKIINAPNVAKVTHEIDVDSYAVTFDGYEPKNNKLFTSPFMKLCVTNNAGEEAEYIIEDFRDRNIMFEMVGDISAVPSVCIYPKHYKHIASAVDFGISLGGFPQCSFNSDAFKLWMNKNFVPMALNVGAAAISGFAGGYALPATGTSYLDVMDRTGNPLQGLGPYQSATAAMMGGGVRGAIVNSAGAILNCIGATYAASKEPNQAHIGSTRNNLLTAIKKNTFIFRFRMIKRHFAEAVDNYFTMFGYQTNKVKMPNLSSRPFFNYVKTIDCTIIGGVPNDDMLTLKGIFDNGVTIWNPAAVVGDYSVNNEPD